MATRQTSPEAIERRPRSSRDGRSRPKARVHSLVGSLMIVAAALAACSSDADNTQPGGSGPTSTPDPTSTATPVPDSGAMEPGTYVVTIGTAFDTAYRITISVPGGWEGYDGWAVAGPAGMGVGFWNVDNVYADPCRWQGTLLDPPVGPRVDDLVAALANQPRRHASTPTEVAVDGFAGKQIELTVPASTADCHEGEFRSWTEQPPVGGASYHMPSEHDLLWIVDVDGDRLVIDAEFLPGTSAQDRAELLQVVNSVRIDPL